MKNPNYHMLIRVTDMHLKDAFNKMASEKGLTISQTGLTKRGMEYCNIGHYISVGTSDKFNVNWIENEAYATKREIVPVYDIQLDWVKIKERLNAYAQAIGSESTNDSDCYTCSEEEIEDTIDTFTSDGNDTIEINHTQGEIFVNDDYLADISTFKNILTNHLIDSYIINDVELTQGDINAIKQIIKTQEAV